MGSRNALPEDFRQVIRMLEDHLFPVEDAVSIIASIGEVPGLLRAWTENPARFTKIMVSVG
jgi:threonine dehydrogenase-like Zn-dependent dehydrogenase